MKSSLNSALVEVLAKTSRLSKFWILPRLPILLLFMKVATGLVSLCPTAGLLVFTLTAAALEVPLTVKECAGVGITNYPVTVVVPLPQGQCPPTSSFSVAPVGGEAVPAQWEALERWLGDGSLRHIRVLFPATVGAWGSANYLLRDTPPASPSSPMTVQVTTTNFIVVTGPLRCVVPRTSGQLLAGVWLDRNTNGNFESTEQMVADTAQNGGVFQPRSGTGPMQYDSSRTNLMVELEEQGPLRVVFRMDSPARFTDTNHHEHGFAVRLYAYAGQPWLKIDYQLQNSDKTVVRSWPLYFEAMGLDFQLKLAASATARFGLGNGAVLTTTNDHGAYLAQEIHNRFRIYDAQSQAVLHDSGTLPDLTGPEGFVDISDAQSGVMAAIRNFWQTWPNGLRWDAQNHLSLQLFPPWSAQWFEGQISPIGLFWLEDMQHVLKETLLSFHGPGVAPAELIRLARTFQFPPVVIVPTDWYRQTHATLELGGAIPPAAVIPVVDDQRQPAYDEYWLTATNPYYGAGWVNFRDPEPGYRTGPCTTGGWPYSGAYAVASGNPSDYFAASDAALGEINLRPEWLNGYTHDADWAALQLTENPYCGGIWRLFEGHGIPTIAAPRLPGTGDGPVYGARDDQHGWFYHVHDAYWQTGDPWLADWYRFVAEFRRTRLERLDPWPDTSSRATAHSLSHAMHAFRVTGDVSILDRWAEHLRRFLRPDQDPLYGDQLESVEENGGGFQTGYLMRVLVNFLEETRAAGRWQDYAEGFNYLSGLMEWNRNHGSFAYYFNARTQTGSVSSGTGLNLVDPQAWYYWHTGRRAYWDHLQTYVTGGINGGEGPYGEFDSWRGQFEGRYYLFVKNTARADTNPPAAATGVQAIPGGGKVLLKWIAPAEAARYHVVWGLKPITAQSTLNPSTLNWWAANAIGPNLTPQAGRIQRVVITPGTNATVYAALFSFDAAENMSEMSVVASTAAVPPDTQPPRLDPTLVAAWACPLCPTNGVAVSFNQTATDNTDPDVTLAYSPPSGSLFKVGTHTIQCTAMDFAGNAATNSFPLTVLTNPPPANIQPQGNSVILSLPQGCVHYRYQSAANLNPLIQWQTMTVPISTNAGLRYQSFPAAQAAEYFRLSN